MKKTLTFAFVCFLISFSMVFGVVSSNVSYNWYCKRNSQHLQPVIDKEMAFVEDYSCYYVDKKHGDASDKKVVYLTFDAGYENGNVEKILDILSDKNVTGAFFVLKNLVVKNTSLVTRMKDEGHLVCNHTAMHSDISKAESIEEFRVDVENLENVYRQYTGREIDKFFRPPEGRFSENALKFAQQMGYKTVLWSLAYADWDNQNQPQPKQAVKKIMDNIHNGAIILLHPTSDTNVQILGEIIDTLQAQGYTFGSLDQL